MASIRWRMAVRAELERIQIPYAEIESDIIETIGDVPQEKMELFRNSLNQLGFELIRNRNEILAGKIENAIKEVVHSTELPGKFKLSAYLSKKLNYDYNYLANVFSEVKGTTIEKFFIQNKIQRVKELLVYNELSIKEISFLTQYSSVAHLSNQFKKVTGVTPSSYKQLYSNSSARSLQVNC